MASQISHALVGRRALRLAFPDKATSILERSGTWFNLGCQGPDIFSHNQRTRPLSVTYGSLLHRRGRGTFLGALAEQASGEGLDSPLSAFVLGFVTHVGLDRLTHPYIVYKAGWDSPDREGSEAYRSAHPFLERILDAALWKRETGGDIRTFMQADALVPEAALPEAFTARIARALVMAYPERAGTDTLLERRIRNGFVDSEFFYRHTDPSITSMSGENPSGYGPSFIEHGYRAVALVYPEGIERALDWANEDAALWLHPCDDAVESRRSYYGLCDEAAQESSRHLEYAAAALGGIAGAASALAASVGGGTLNVGNSKGEQTRPRFMDPFPLKRYMEEQFSRRADFLRRKDEEGGSPARDENLD